MRFLECCCTSFEEAAEAEKGGAKRVELCSELGIGGVTPPMEMVKQTIEGCKQLAVNVLIRPRGGDFVYSEDEIQQMIASIKDCKALGVNAVVIGALHSDGGIDIDTTGRLIDEARPMKITFHRAFDECADPHKALEDIIDLGCERLLTSGHEPDAFTGRFLIADLVKQARGRIVIMAGGGVRPHNIASIEAETGATEFHSSSHGDDGRTDRNIVKQLRNTSI